MNETNHTIPFSIKLRHVFWIIFICIWFSGCSNEPIPDNDAEYIEMEISEYSISSDNIDFASIYGVSSRNKKDLVKWLKSNTKLSPHDRYVLSSIIVFGRITISADFKDYKDIPEKSLKFDCPVEDFDSCYFIKYEDDINLKGE